MSAFMVRVRGYAKAYAAARCLGLADSISSEAA